VNSNPRRSCPRRKLPLLAAIAFVAVLPAFLAARQSLQRDLFVSIVDKAGAPVATAVPSDLVIREDGQIREILAMRKATEPIDVAVLMDTSAAAVSQFVDLRQGVESFIAGMKGHAQISLVEFGERPRVLAGFTTSATALAEGMGLVFGRTRAGAYTIEAVLETVGGLQQRNAERKAIIVVWLGGTEFSSSSAQEAIEKLTACGASLNVITVTAGTPADNDTLEGRQREMLFDRGTDLTGGSRQNIVTSMGIKPALNRVTRDLLGQYRVTYARPDRLIPPEKITVASANRALTVRGTPSIIQAPGRR